MPIAVRLSTLFFTLLFLSTLASAGEVTGTIKYEGKIPKLKPLKMAADPECETKHTSAPLAEFLVLGEGNTMGNIFVQVKKGLPNKEYPVPSEPVEVNQEGCIYKPHVVGMMKGQTIRFLNSDGILHNVHALPKTNRQFNLAMPATRTEAEKSFGKPEPMFPVKCDVHPWMKAYVAVLEHPYFDVTKADGKFSLKGLAPGTYEIEAWHEKLGTRSASVTITGEETQTLDFTFSRKKKG